MINSTFLDFAQERAESPEFLCKWGGANADLADGPKLSLKKCR